MTLAQCISCQFCETISSLSTNRSQWYESFQHLRFIEVGIKWFWKQASYAAESRSWGTKLPWEFAGIWKATKRPYSISTPENINGGYILKDEEIEFPVFLFEQNLRNHHFWRGSTFFFFNVSFREAYVYFRKLQPKLLKFLQLRDQLAFAGRAHEILGRFSAIQSIHTYI